MDAEMAKRAQEVDKFVRKLDPAVRGEAFSLFRDYILGGGGAAETPPAGRGARTRTTEKKATGGGDAKSFFDKHESDKDHENVLATAAWWYSLYGNSWFEPNKDLRVIADQNSLTVPVRIDMTVRQIERDNKPVFRKNGKRYSPSPAGERFLKKTYGVKKGTGTPPAEEE